MLRHLRLMVLMAALVLLALGAACDDDDNGDGTPAPGETPAETPGDTTPEGTDDTPDAGAEETPEDAAADGADQAAGVEDTVQNAIDAYNDGDADAFFGHFTDDGLRSFFAAFGIPGDDVEAGKEVVAPFIGEDPLTVQELEVTDESEDQATVEMIAEAGAVLEGDRFELVREGEDWLIDRLELFAVSPDVPDDYETVDVPLQEYAFRLEEDTIPAGDVAFALENEGEQPHEAVLARLDEAVDLQEALESEGEPEGVEVIGGVFNVEPGASYNMVLTEPLEPGRYALVCFFPNLDEGPDGTPHALLGMFTEFQVE